MPQFRCSHAVHGARSMRFIQSARNNLQFATAWLHAERCCQQWNALSWLPFCNLWAVCYAMSAADRESLVGAAATGRISLDHTVAECLLLVTESSVTSDSVYNFLLSTSINIKLGENWWMLDRSSQKQCKWRKAKDEHWIHFDVVGRPNDIAELNTLPQHVIDVYLCKKLQVNSQSAKWLWSMDWPWSYHIDYFHTV